MLNNIACKLGWNKPASCLYLIILAKPVRGEVLHVSNSLFVQNSSCIEVSVELVVIVYISLLSINLCKWKYKGYTPHTVYLYSKLNNKHCKHSGPRSASPKRRLIRIFSVCSLSGSIKGCPLLFETQQILIRCKLRNAVVGLDLNCLQCNMFCHGMTRIFLLIYIVCF